MIIDKLIDKIIQTNNPSVIGLDTDFNYLPEEMRAKCTTLEDVADAIQEFNYNLIDALKDLIPAVKVQVAYYEQYGAEGMRAFANTLKYAKECGIITIADVKRNDIGATAGAYSKAYLSGSDINGCRVIPFESDFITVNAYLGEDGIKPFIEDCIKYDRGLFILVKTSNPTSGELQDRLLDNSNTLYKTVGDLVEKWGSSLVGKYGYSSIGAVVGATHPEQASILRKELKHTFFLVPGYGKQGGTAQGVGVSFVDGLGGIVNSSRGILCAYKQDEYKGLNYVDAAVRATIDMRDDLNQAINK